MEGEGAMERRIRIVGLCLIAVFALSAMVAASASASVEFGQCVKQAKGPKGFQGHYQDKACTKAAPPEEIGLGGKLNKYEWVPGGGKNSAFSAKGKEVKLTSGTLEVACKNSAVVSGSASVRGAETLEEKFKFNSCVLPKFAKAQCTTHGKVAGEIETKTLWGSLSEGPEPEKTPFVTFEGKVKGEPKGSPTEVWAEFECNNSVFTLKGALTGKDTQAKNAPGKKGGIEFKAGGAEQELVATFPNPFNIEETEEEPIELTFSQSNKFEVSDELRQL